MVAGVKKLKRLIAWLKDFVQQVEQSKSERWPLMIYIPDLRPLDELQKVIEGMLETMTKKEILRRAKRYVKKWQPKLLLTDWVITVEMVPASKLDEPDDNANIHWFQAIMRAALQISEEFKETELNQLEFTVVHELLHCHGLDWIFRKVMKKDGMALTLSVHWQEMLLDRVTRILVENVP